jgi:hypothetical protein
LPLRGARGLSEIATPITAFRGVDSAQHHGASMKTAHALAAVGLGLLALAGCGGVTGNANQLSPTTAAVQDASASDALMAQTADAATAALVTIATNTGGDPVTTSLASDREPGGMARVDLARIAAVDLVQPMSGLRDSLNNPRFPNCTGSIHIQSSGTAVPSWPTASSGSAGVTVTVLFDQGDVTFTDPQSGAVATISGGSYTYSLASNYTYTSLHNWVLNIDVSHVIASGTPLTVSIARTGRPTRTVSLFGARDAHLILTRVDNGGTTNTYSVDTTIDGAPDGPTNVDTTNPPLSFTNWDFTINGSSHVVWNRHAHLTYHWDFVAGGGAILDASSDEIFITINGSKLGPYTAAQLILAFRASPK